MQGKELELKFANLRAREVEIVNRENDLNNAIRDFNAKQYAAYTSNPALPATAYAQTAPYRAPISPTEPVSATPNIINYGDLHERASAEGIRVHTAGNLSGVTARQQPSATHANGATFNKGLALFKSALIVLCIGAIESIAAFFLKDTLGITVWYPILACLAALTLMIVCTCLWANGYQPQARKRKHAPYFLTAGIMFVICVIVVTMIAVILGVDLKNMQVLLSMVIVPFVYLLNILLYAVFYHLFATQAVRK